MTRRKKDARSRADKRARHAQEQRRQQDVIQHSAATLTCASETAADFGWLCTEAQEELGLDLPYLRLALEIWGAHHQSATDALVATLDELLSERVRHQQALQRIALHLQHLAADPSLHIHLDPLERYRELVRQRLFPQPPEDPADPPIS
jgi:hypothetical protein